MAIEKNKSPLIPRKIAAWIARSEDKATIYGDMEEYFQELVDIRGSRRARIWYWQQAIFGLPALISNSFNGGIIMINNYFKTAFRNLIKHRGYSFINIIGLAIGMACCLLILMYVNHELSYDNYNEKADRIYRVASEAKFGGRHYQLAVLPAAAASTFIKEFPEVMDAVRFRRRGSYIIRYKDSFFKERKIVFSDTSFFNVFTVPLLMGDAKTALNNPNTLVMSSEAAKKIFGKKNPVGKTLILDKENEYRVTGVFAKIPENSHFHFDFIASLNSLKESDPTNWLSDNFNTYLLLNENADPMALEAKFPAIIKKYFSPEIHKVTGKSFEELVKSGNISLNYYLQPLHEIHLHSDLTAELGTNSDIKYVYLFSAIAFFILIIAAINFMNLSTARSAGRAREVGLRKVMGSQRRQLIYQFLTESIMLSCISMILAVVVINLMLPYFNHLSGKNLLFWSHLNPGLACAMMAIVLITGLLAGLYPAVFISAFKPVNVLSGQARTGVKSGILRSILVVFQFTASIILIIGTLVVMNQLNYIQTKKLGFDKERVLILDDTYMIGKQAEVFKNEMLKNRNIKMGTVSGYLPVPSSRNNNAVFPEGELDSKNTTSVQNWSVDHDYIKTMGMKIVAGRNFSRNFPTDSSAVIINRRMAEHFGWENPLGKRIGSLLNRKGEKKLFTVIGVVENFHFESLRNNIAPVILFLRESTSMMSFRLSGNDIPGTIKYIKDGWCKFLPGQPFEYTFMDDSFDSLYKSEQRIGSIFASFAVLAIFIGCLGLFGLAAFISEQRTKEIGIRKVLGATVPSIIKLLSREFFILVVLANILAWPIAYILMNNWLQDFAYKASVNWVIFVSAGFISLTIALLTTSYQAVRVALTNPINSIKYE